MRVDIATIIVKPLNNHLYTNYNVMSYAIHTMCCNSSIYHQVSILVAITQVYMEVN